MPRGNSRWSRCQIEAEVARQIRPTASSGRFAQARARAGGARPGSQRAPPGKMTVAEVSGASRESGRESGARSGSVSANAKAQRAWRSATMWRRNEMRSSRPAGAASGSSHSGVSWSTSVSSTAAAAGSSGAGAVTPRADPMQPPGRAIASARRGRRLRVGNRIGEAGQRDWPHERMFRMAKNCTRVAAAFAGPRRAVPAAPRPAVRSPSPASSRARRVLQQRVGDRGQFGLALIAAGDIGMADASGSVRTVQRVTVISPRLNGAPPPPARPRTITSPVSGPRSTRVPAGSGPSAGQPCFGGSRWGARQDRHPTPTRGAAVDSAGNTASGMASACACLRCLDSYATAIQPSTANQHKGVWLG